MVSWRCKDAPIFTLAYRGEEVDALHRGFHATGECVESSSRSRTVMFSHLTGECFVARESIHLDPGDPHMIVQCITEAYTQREGQGYVDLSGEEIVSR